GYAGYYLVRKNFTLAIPYLIDRGFNTAELGIVAAALSIAYGISKFVMGNVSDRCNPRYFLATGLILSGIINFFFGYASTIFVMFVLMLANGWVQGMGWPPCGRTLAHWFSDKERGTKMSIWNTAHNLGGGIVAPLATLGILLFADWMSIFYFPAVIAVVIGLLILIFGRDTPQSVGLPPIEEHKNDYPCVCVEDREKELSAKEILFNHVLCNKWLWFIAIANVFVYLVRYGVVDWVPLYLTKVKGFSNEDSRWAFFFFEYAAIPGTILVGWISDRFFHGRRAPIAIICMVGVTISAIVYWFSDSVLITNLSVSAIGFLIYGPVMLIGVSALDMVPKKAAGTAAGFTGLFGYFFGAVMADALIGIIVNSSGWNGWFALIMASCVLSIFFLALTWNVHDRSKDNAPARAIKIARLKNPPATSPTKAEK
ncbi:MAG: MFS transporter, partial [Candidatus Thermoplasmatota archaeon]|nr:MFS transporter [Candidatus Thermoplasmatota archaeon]